MGALCAVAARIAAPFGTDGRLSGPWGVPHAPNHGGAMPLPDPAAAVTLIDLAKWKNRDHHRTKAAPGYPASEALRRAALDRDPLSTTGIDANCPTRPEGFFAATYNVDGAPELAG